MYAETGRVSEIWKFEIVAEDPHSRARVAKLHTPHGTIWTPCFLPVGTLGAPKAIHCLDLLNAGVSFLMTNAFHLYLRPGLDVIQHAGGVHAWTSWDGPIMTDSGGYQIFSLERVQVSEEGVRFPSPYDGSYHFFTPEKVVEIHRVLGSDICMALDVCPPYPAGEEVVQIALERTQAWWIRAVQHWKTTYENARNLHQILCPVLQGGVYPHLRKRHIEWLLDQEPSLPFPLHYIAIGGLSVGEPEEQMYEMVEQSTRLLPRNIPRHLLGVGTPANIIRCVQLGVDTFDCVIPTRNGRRGLIYTWHGILYLHNQKWKYDNTTVDPESRSLLARMYTRSFVRHLLKSGEILGMMIATHINLFFYMDLMQEIRRQILRGTFSQWADKVLPELSRRL